MDLAPGMRLGERYVLGQRLAGGGTGEVWRAADELLGRPVAVKVPRAAFAADPEFRDRLLAEARHAASLVHPGIAGVYDVDAGDEVPYLVLELVEGRPLSVLLAQEAPLPPERARHLICQVARALAAAHANGLVHRDVKPSNLMVTEDDTVKVTDFGIARAVDHAATTRIGFVTGTAQYLSPEQAGGASASPASDMYALGVVAYECLVGCRPFDGDPLAVLRAHCESPVPELPRHLPADLRRLVLRLLAKDPDRRPTAEQVAGGRPPEVLTQALALPRPAEPPVPYEPPAPAAPDAARSRRGPRLLLAGAAVAVTASALVLFAPYDRSGEESAASAQEGPEATAPVPVQAVSLFHPEGSGNDGPGEVGLAVDGDPATAWTTQRYNTPEFGNLRPGVGLLLDLGTPQQVREVRVKVGTPGLSLRVHAATAPDPSLLDTPPVGASASAPAEVVVTPPEPVTAQFWVVWIDRLPQEGEHRAAVSEVVLTG
jgi:hypothetical protein